MKPPAIPQSSLAAFRFLLFSPHARQHNYFFQKFIANLENCIFVAVDGNVDQPPELLAQIVHAIAEQGGKANQLNQALSRAESDPKTLANALIEDLSAHVEYLILDNTDQIILDAAFLSFFEQLAKAKTSPIKVIFHGRTLNENFWNSLLQSGHAVILENDGKITSQTISSTQQHLEVNAFAGHKVFCNGLPIETWDGPLVQNLFFYLVDHDLVTRNDIFETFWPMLNKKEATNVFHVTKRKVSQTVNCEITDFRNGFYRHAPEIAISYDVARFQSLVRQADHSEAVLKEIIALHRHPFLYGIEMPWVQARREELHQQYVESLLELARLYRGERKLDLAVNYLGRAQQQVPEREDIARDLIRLYTELGAADHAAQVFHRLRHVLNRRYRIGPSATTIQVYEAMQKIQT